MTLLLAALVIAVALAVGYPAVELAIGVGRGDGFALGLAGVMLAAGFGLVVVFRVRRGRWVGEIR